MNASFTLTTYLKMIFELTNLHCVKMAKNYELRPLAELDVLDHVHGGVSLQPEDGAPVNDLSYWSSNSACLGQWLHVFTDLHARIAVGGNFTYEFPYPEQGEPKLEFIFSDDLVRIVTTLYVDDSRTEVEEIWEPSAPRNRFESMVGEALALIETTILEANPANGPAWLERNRGG